MTRITFRLSLCKILSYPFLFYKQLYTRDRKSKIFLSSRHFFLWPVHLQSMTSVVSKQSKPLYEDIQKYCTKKWHHSTFVTPRDRNKRMTIAQSEFQFICRARPLSLFLSFSFSIGAPIYDILHLVTDANTMKEERVAQESSFTRIIKRDHHPYGMSRVLSASISACNLER